MWVLAWHLLETAIIRGWCLLQGNCEYGNEHNKHAVAVLKNGEIVSHLPCTISHFLHGIHDFALYKLLRISFWAYYLQILRVSTSNCLAAASFDVFGHLNRVVSAVVAGAIIATWILCHVPGIY